MRFAPLRCCVHPLAPGLLLLGLLLAPALPAIAEDYGGGGAGSFVQPPAKEEDGKRKTYTIQPRVSRYLAKALKLMQDNQLGEAQSILERIAGNRSLNAGEQAKIQQFLGNVFVYKNEPAVAVKHLDEALRLEGLDPGAEQQVTFQIASLHAQMGNFAKAKEILDVWFQTATEPTPEAWYLRAIVFLQMEEDEEAVKAAEKAVELSPAPREGWLALLAQTYYKVEDFQKMASTLERLIAIAPDKKSYWMLLSAAYFELDRDGDARSAVQLAYRQGLLDQEREYRALSRLLLASGLPWDGAAVIEKGMADKILPGQKEDYELLTNCLLQARESERALGPLAKGAELSKDAQLSMVLGKVHLQNYRFEEALKALTQGLEKALPDQKGRVYLLIGVAQLGANRLDEAESAFRMARSDERARGDADNYLKFLIQERERRRSLGA
jgi:tetratricopeptide (TPR) repeat protein